MERHKLRNKLGIFFIVLSVLIAGGCAGYGDSEETGPAEETIEEETIEEENVEEENVEEENVEEENVEEETETGAETGEGTETDIIDVEIRDFKYIPEELTVSIGQTVRWTNYDTAVHDVDGSGLDSQDMRKGDIFTFTFEEAGTYDYLCTFHRFMKGTVIVSE